MNFLSKDDVRLVQPIAVESEDLHDGAHPLKWTSRRKWMNVWLIASQALLSPLCSTILAVGAVEIRNDFHLTSIYTPNLPVGMYVLGLGLGPLWLGPLSEIYGRRIIYLISFAVFTVINVGCALAPDITALAILRLLAGICGSAATTLGGASIGDMFLKEDRGKAQALYSLGPTTGPVIGPLIGAFIVNGTHGWRWLIWVIVIASGTTEIFCFLFLKETYAPFLQRQKAKKSLKANPAITPSNDETSPDLNVTFFHAITRPLRLLAFSPICTLMSLYMSLIYGILYLHLVTLPLLYGPISVYGLHSYRWQHGLTGLAFLGPAVGLTIGIVICAKYLNSSYAYLARRSGSKPENRMLFLQIGMIIVPIGLIIFAWTAEKQTPWIAPLIGAAVFAVGMLMAYVCIQTYLVDVYEPFGASALAAATFTRGLTGCVFPIVGFRLYSTLHYSWGTMLIALLCVAMLPVPLVLYCYGPRLRRNLAD